MVFDGGLVTVPVAVWLVGIVAAAIGGVGVGCYTATGSALCERKPIEPRCPYLENATDVVEASWHPVDSASVSQTVTLRANKQRSREWASSVERITTSPAATFVLDALGGVAWYLTQSPGVGLAVASAPQKQSRFAASYVLLTSEADALEVTCPPGVVWQWQLQVTKADSCGVAEQVGTNNVRCSPNANTPPCCLPGYERAPSDPHAGGCLPDPDNLELETRLSSALCGRAEAAKEDGTGPLLSRAEPPARLVQPLHLKPRHAGGRERHVMADSAAERQSGRLPAGASATAGGAVGVGLFLLVARKRAGVAVL